jgi:hypothetical protein
MSKNLVTVGGFYKIPFFLFILSFGLFQNAHSQVSESSELFKKMVSADSLLFQEGFNKCDFSVVKDLIHADLEFFHDISGTENRTEFLQGFERNICSTPDKKPIRKLVSESLKVFGLKKNGELYGAIQKGTHRFYIKEPGKDLYYTTSARFTNVWVLKNNGWKLKTVLSYDHGKEN